MGKLIGCKLNKAEKYNERAYFYILYCSCPTKCPLLEKYHECIHSAVLSICKYASQDKIEGPTKRAKSYNNFIIKYKEELENSPKWPSGFYKKHICLIGDYYYLPYSHINHWDGKNTIPFLSHSNILSNGSKFIKKEDFTSQVIYNICNLRPNAMMGGEIKSYQEEEVPKFLFHLKYLFPKLYKEILKIDPTIKDKILKLDNIKDIKCFLNNIPVGLTDGYLIYKKLKVKKWDGKKIVLYGKQKDFGFFLVGFKSNDIMELTFTPVERETEVLIIDNELKIKTCIEYPELVK